MSEEAPTDPVSTEESDEQSEARPSGPSIRDPALRPFRDVPIEVSVLLDKKTIRFGEVLSLNVNSVVKLVRSAGENVDLLLDGLVVGDGEIVVIDDLMGLRITDIHRDSEVP